MREGEVGRGRVVRVLKKMCETKDPTRAIYCRQGASFFLIVSFEQKVMISLER